MRLSCFLLFFATGLCGQLLTREDRNKVSSGYVFVSPMASNHSYLLENDGTVAHRWTGSMPGAVAVKLLPNGNLIRMEATVNNAFPGAVGMGGAGLLEELDWNGRVLWTYTLSNDQYLHHHDFQVLPNGNLLLIAWEKKLPEEARAAGRDPAKIAPQGIWSEALLEVQPSRPAGGKIVWEWHMWDHLVQDYDATKANFGVVADAVGKLDLNFVGATANPSSNPNWIHKNSLDYHPGRDEILMGSRLMSEIWVIPHGPGRGGDFLYRWGNPQVYRQGAAADQKLFLQHHAQWIPSGYPGAGHILLLNNGVGRGYSSADELEVPPDYARSAGKAFGPEVPAWTFGQQLGTTFYSLVAGSVQRLPNGNTLIGLPNAARAVEVTPEGEIVWDMGLSTGESGGFGYRVTRLATSTPGLAATSLYRPAPSILHAASRLPGAIAPASLIGISGHDGSWSITDSTGTLFPLLGKGFFALPSALAIGPARVTGATESIDVRVDRVAPGVFSANGDGKGGGLVLAVVGASVRPAWQPVEWNGLHQSLYLLVYGSGLRGGSISATLAGDPIPVNGVAPADGLIGVDVASLGPVPRKLAHKGQTELVLSSGDKRTNPVSVWLY